MYSYYGSGARKFLVKRQREIPQKSHIKYTRFTRVPVEIKVEETEEVLAGRGFLFDFRATSFSLFSMEALEKGTKVSLVLEHPRKIFIRGEVAWCTLMPWNPRILSEKKVPYRIYVNFEFETEEERLAVQQFCNQIS